MNGIYSKIDLISALDEDSRGNQIEIKLTTGYFQRLKNALSHEFESNVSDRGQTPTKDISSTVQSPEDEFILWVREWVGLPEYLDIFTALKYADIFILGDIDDDFLKEEIGMDNGSHRETFIYMAREYLRLQTM